MIASSVFYRVRGEKGEREKESVGEGKDRGEREGEVRHLEIGGEYLLDGNPIDCECKSQDCNRIQN
jgi:hypothetical protein